MHALINDKQNFDQRLYWLKEQDEFKDLLRYF